MTTCSDFVVVNVLAKQKANQFHGAVGGSDLASTYAKAKDRVENPPKMM